MFVKRTSIDRGTADHGWLQAKHSFSFADYYDPQHMGFRDLRVINEDRVAPKAGFPTHGHRDMEIITYPLSGAIAHKDSTGADGIIRPGEVQVMSAGSGVRHSEYNALDNEELHLLQIWIQPRAKGVAPRYDQRAFPPDTRKNQLTLLVSGEEGEEDALFIHADAKIYGGVLSPGSSIMRAHSLERFGWIQVARGSVDVNGHLLEAGDGLAFGDEAEITIKASAAMDATDQAEFLLFDLK